ncbi:hypothetical protein [uncultured Dialister sp.]|uniref:hypothetical protein n=1 Tax=uncultured Dialister sp. TaxID=278064 RepID=UPI00260F0EA0|nr:hypothetical protein [uncultured Dialister sp.]
MRQHVPFFLKRSGPLEAFSIFRGLISPLYFVSFDSQEQEAFILDKMIDFWEGILQKAGPEEKEVMHRWFLSQRKLLDHDSTLAAVFDRVLVEEMDDRSTLPGVLDWVLGKIRTSKPRYYLDSPEYSENLLEAVRLMCMLDYPMETMTEFIEQHSDNSCMHRLLPSENRWENRQRLLEEARHLSAELWASRDEDRMEEEAIHAVLEDLLDGLRAGEEKGEKERKEAEKKQKSRRRPRKSKEEKENDGKLLCEAAAYKEHASPGEWRKYIRNMVGALADEDEACRLMVKEHMYDDLFTYIKNHELTDLMIEYEPRLKKKYLREIRDYYCAYAEEKMPRFRSEASLKECVSCLKHVLTFPKGKVMAMEVVNRLKQKYPGKKTMLQALEEGGF